MQPVLFLKLDGIWGDFVVSLQTDVSEMYAVCFRELGFPTLFCVTSQVSPAADWMLISTQEY